MVGSWRPQNNFGISEVEPRTGLDGKTRRMPIERLADKRLEAELQTQYEIDRARAKTKEQIAREYKALKRIESERAKLREEKGRPKKGPANLPEVPEQKGDARDLAAAQVGLSPPTAERLETVVDAIDEAGGKARHGDSSLPANLPASSDARDLAAAQLGISGRIAEKGLFLKCKQDYISMAL